MPFDLFGGGGAGRGAELLAEAFQEMLADNRCEKILTRAAAYKEKVKVHEFVFETESSYVGWRDQARREARKIFDAGEFLLWVTGNHLGVLPIYEELPSGTLVLQLDAHLDIYNLSDGKKELSHGNFLLHAEQPLPGIINLGSRDLLLRPDYCEKYYQGIYAAAELALDPVSVLRKISRATNSAKHIFVDIDYDVFDPAFFPAVTHPQPFGLSPWFLLHLLEKCWSEKVLGLAISEFDPGRDQRDQSLAILLWLLEYLLLKKHERG